MKRRDFIKTSSALLASQAFAARMLSAAPTHTENRFKQIAVMNTFIDWYFGWSPSKVGKEPLSFSVEAVKAILDRHAAAGNKTVYWRATDGGDAMYWSTLCRVSHGPTTESTRKHYGPALTEKFKEYDFKKFDVFRTAVDYAHELGMRVLAWFECDNEDHGLGLSEFVLKHPQMCKVYQNKLTSEYGLSWAFPEVVQYKVGMAKEMLDYGCDGLFFDLVRGNQSRCIDADGVALWGYSEPSVAAYREKTGQDAFAIPILQRFVGQAPRRLRH